MAGIAAEMFFFGKNSNGHQGDYEMIMSLTKDDRVLQDELLAYTCDLASQFSDVIETLAIVLRDRRYLTGKQVDALVSVLRANRGPGVTLQ
jgi:hypothetical protein